MTQTGEGPGMCNVAYPLEEPGLRWLVLGNRLPQPRVRGESLNPMRDL